MRKRIAYNSINTIVCEKEIKTRKNANHWIDVHCEVLSTAWAYNWIVFRSIYIDGRVCKQYNQQSFVSLKL